MCTHKLALNVIAEWFKARVFEWKRPECMSQVGCSFRRATRALRLSSFPCRTARTVDRRAEYESGATYICKCWAEGKNKCAWGLIILVKKLYGLSGKMVPHEPNFFPYATESRSKYSLGSVSQQLLWPEANHSIPTFFSFPHLENSSSRPTGWAPALI